MLKLTTVRIRSTTLCVALCWLASPGFGWQQSVLERPGSELELNPPANNPLSAEGLKPTTPLSVQAAQDPDRELDLLTKGPLHEAFAELPQNNPAPNPLVNRQPPEPVKELPPKYQPEGENVEWIPGYWAWDEDRNDFLWISGIWRDIPPGQRWVPGYWNEEDGGFRWVNGLWMDDKVEEIEYLPPPPESLDQGPSTPAPSDAHFYAPGNWVYQDNDYVWQAGCWMPRVDNWVWVQPCYVWTPRGCIFRSGYWDRLIDCRGVVFAPVCYRRPVYLGVDYYYTPSCVINTNFDLLPHLFVRRNCRSYYFGDWYDHRYVDRGFCAWSGLNLNIGFGRCHDPFFVYYSHSSVRYNNLAVVSWARNQYDFCYQNIGYRPPALFNINLNIVNQKTIINGQPAPQPIALAKTLEQQVKTTARRSDGREAFRQLAEEERRDFQKRSQPIQEIARERRAAELPVAAQRSAQRRAERELAKSGDTKPGENSDPLLEPAGKPNPETSRPEKLALPKVDRRQQIAADRAAAELKRQQEKDEQTARTEERRAAAEAASAARREPRAPGKTTRDNPLGSRPNSAAEQVAGTEPLPNPGEPAKPRPGRGRIPQDAAGSSADANPPTVQSEQPERLTPEQRRAAIAARQAEQRGAQQARDSARELARQQEAAAREIERQQRLPGRSAPQSETDRVFPGQATPANSSARDLERAGRFAVEQQQRQQRDAELQQRRANDQSARQAVEQQRSAEQALRRQQEIQDRAVRQQQDMQQREARRMQDQMRQQQQQQQQQMQQQQQQARESAARQQREMDRQQREMQRQQQQQQMQQQQQQQDRPERRKRG